MSNYHNLKFQSKIKLLQNPNIQLKFSKERGIVAYLDYGKEKGLHQGPTVTFEVPKTVTLNNIKLQWYKVFDFPPITDYL